ncbi:hypothetical protein PGTUg99_019854 [Puccinia graminis f. sp. tritici]|uniref:Uncharacterized protein n=1 Tax=Puccinia graminis f. sp. tritici TaxID=56615 RepID=A0A5B0PWI1_PUCGR|nr:hypothetical protein PGTUg99_019854 [Puccinia graminis f. sp. tritici]
MVSIQSTSFVRMVSWPNSSPLVSSSVSLNPTIIIHFSLVFSFSLHFGCFGNRTRIGYDWRRCQFAGSLVYNAGPPTYNL